MVKFFTILVVVLIGVIAFGYFGASLPDSNPLAGVASGIRSVVGGIVDGIASVGRGLARNFGA